MTGEDMRHPALLKQVQKRASLLAEHVVILVRLVDAFDEPGRWNDYMSNVLRPAFSSSAFSQVLLAACLVAPLGDRMRGIEHQTNHRARAERGKGGRRAEAAMLSGVGSLSRRVARELVQRMERSSLAAIRRYCRSPFFVRLVDQIARDNDESRLEAVGRGDGELEIGRLQAVGILGAEAELRSLS